MNRQPIYHRPVPHHRYTDSRLPTNRGLEIGALTVQADQATTGRTVSRSLARGVRLSSRHTEAAGAAYGAIFTNRTIGFRHASGSTNAVHTLLAVGTVLIQRTLRVRTRVGQADFGAFIAR